MSVRHLGAIEARRLLTGPPLWLGAAASLALVPAFSVPTWQGGSYELLPMYFVPLAAGLFVAGVRSGGRDHHPRRAALAEAAPLDADARSIGRLLGLVPAVVLVALAVVVVAVGARIEGGYWLGDEPGRIDDALHTIPELIQPWLLCALAGVTGVAVGRGVRRSAPVAVLGVALFFVFGAVSWAWQWEPARYVAPVQNQPVVRAVAAPEVDPTTLPDEWLLAEPGEFNPEWDQVLVVPAMAAWHDVYLVGAIALAAGVAVRGRRGRAVLAVGAALVVLGVAAQVAVAPAPVDLLAVAP